LKLAFIAQQRYRPGWQRWLKTAEGVLAGIQQIHPGRKGPVLAPGKRCRNTVPGHHQQDLPLEPHGHAPPRSGMLHHWSA
jgi:hypothetical protein